MKENGSRETVVLLMTGDRQGTSSTIGQSVIHDIQGERRMQGPVGGALQHAVGTVKASKTRQISSSSWGSRISQKRCRMALESHAVIVVHGHLCKQAYYIVYGFEVFRTRLG